MGVVSSAEDVWVDTANQVANGLRSHGIPVVIIVTVDKDAASVRRALVAIKTRKHLRSECSTQTPTLTLTSQL